VRGFLLEGLIPTAALVELSAGEAKVAGYVVRRCRIYRNVPLRQVLKKVLGTPAVVVNDDGIVSLLC
jgi:hypothetical protein